MEKSLGVGIFAAVFLVLVGIFGLISFDSGDGITGRALDSGDTSGVSRSFSGDVVDTDIVVTVAVLIDPGFAHSVYAVEETIPAGFSLVDAGSATVSGNVLKWYDLDEINNVSSVDLTYTITTSQVGTHYFSGSYGIDGMDSEEFVGGPGSLIVQSQVVSDNTAPVFVFGTVEYASSYSPTFNTVFSVLWSDNVAVVERLIEKDFSGSFVNTTGSSWSGVLGAGSYNWRSYARDFAGNWGSTPLQSFSIPKGNPNLALSLNGIEGDISVGVGEDFNVLASARKGVNLYVDGVSTSNGLKNYNSGGVHNFTAVVVSDSNYTGDSVSRFVTVSGTPSNFDISWNSSKWLAGTTNFSEVNLSGFVGRFVNQFGEIRFLEDISASRSLNLHGRVNIGDRFVFVDSGLLPEFNRSAELRFYNVNLNEPILLKDGLACPSCNISSYISGTVIAQVDSFSTYSLVDNAPDPDSGDSGGSSSGGGGGGGGSSDIPGLSNTCVSDYLCGKWEECVNGSMKLVCVDVNKCEVDKIKVQSCEDEETISLKEKEKKSQETRIWIKVVAVAAVALFLIAFLVWLWIFRREGRGTKRSKSKWFWKWI